MNILDIIRSYKEYQELKAEVEAQLEELKKQAVAYLTEAGKDEEVTEAGKITYRQVISNRIDSTAMKNQIPDVYKAFLKPSVSMRFTCN